MTARYIAIDWGSTNLTRLALSGAKNAWKVGNLKQA
ncbi:Uncharacterised protein [Klebsiella pneumoniae]|uniref:2-dehydro-3-deoxygalactonokinase n=1 Tax=Klebsiella pneumoniae TaxID=573 RepID=A0A377TH78_KLEPN|nr:Uncharacterised protein [Klebsiella pneumoniae]